MDRKVRQLVVWTDLILMTEATKNNFKFSPEEMNEIRCLEDTCRKLSQAVNLTDLNEALEATLKATEES